MTGGWRARLRATLQHHGGSALRRGLLAGLVVFLLVVGAEASYAAWTHSVTVTSSASVSSLTLTTANFTSSAFTFKNHALRTTGSVTVTNTTSTTSSTVPALTLDFDILSGNAALAGNLQLAVWPSTLGACVAGTATPGGAVTGTWAAFPEISSTLPTATAVTYCVRSFGADRSDLGAATGTAAIAPRVSATLTVGGFATTATATTSQDTQLIYPVASPNPLTWYNIRTTESPVTCLRANGTGNGSAIIESSCSTATSRQWRFDSAGGDYYDVQSRNAPTVRWDNNASAATAAAVTLRTNNDGLVGQQWQLQQVSTGVFQLVNNLSGLCLQTAATAAAQVTCAGTAAQRYTLSVVSAVANIDTLTCSNTGTTGTSRRVAYTWDPVASETYSVQYRAVGSTGTWTQVASLGTGVGSYTWVTGATTPATVGEWDVRVITGTSTSAAVDPLETETVYRGTDASGAYLRCAQPPAAITTIACADTGTTGTSRRVQYTWDPYATESYSVQYRALGSTGDWTQIATVAGGIGSYTWPATSPTPGTDAVYDVRVVAGSSVLAGEPSLAVESVWRGTGSAGAYLRCDKPVPSIPATTCTNTGTTSANWRITYSWTQEAIEPYTLQIRDSGGVWSDFATIPVGTVSIAMNPTTAQVPLTWAAATYNARIVVGSTTIVTDTFTVTGAAPKYLRC